MKKIISYYTILLGFGIIILWIIILSSDGMSEGNISSTFHLISEFGMAALCLIAGLQQILIRKASLLLMIVAHAMIIYSVINAAGYYGQQSGLLSTLPFAILGLFSVLILSMQATYLKKIN